MEVSRLEKAYEGHISVISAIALLHTGPGCSSEVGALSIGLKRGF